MDCDAIETIFTASKVGESKLEDGMKAILKS
jgi:hypothetical protein